MSMPWDDCVYDGHFLQHDDGDIYPAPWMQMRQVDSVVAPSKSGSYGVTGGGNKNDLLQSLAVTWVNNSPMPQLVYGLLTRGGCQVTLQARSRAYLALYSGQSTGRTSSIESVPTPIPLGLHGFLKDRTTAQRTSVLNAMNGALLKGGDVVNREEIMWSDAQPTEGGAYNWTVADGIVTACADKGIRLWAILSHPPTWATAPGAPAGYGAPCPPYADVTTAGGNSALAAYAAFCLAAAQRYGPTGTFWATYSGVDRPVVNFEVWNEEYTTLASSRYTGGVLTPGYSNPAGYAAIFNAAAAQLHTIPGVKVAASLTDKTYNAATPGTAYLDTFLTNVTERVDVASLHPYVYNYQAPSYTPPLIADRWQYFTQVADVRAKLVAAGRGDTDIWITEISWPTHSTGLSENVQATRFADLWAMLQSMDYVKGLIIFTTTLPAAPDRVGLPGYADGQENFLALWHTGTTAYDLGAAKPAVATVTMLPAITRQVQTTVTTDNPATLVESSRVGCGVDAGKAGLLATGTGFCINEVRQPSVSFPLQPDLIGWTLVNPGERFNAKAELRFISDNWESTTLNGGNSGSESSYITGDTRLDVFAVPAVGPVPLHVVPQRIGTPTSVVAPGQAFTLPKPIGTAEGDLMVAFTVSQFGSISAMYAPAGWTKVGEHNVGTPLMHLRIFVKVATNAEPNGYVFGNPFLAEGGGVLMTYRGADWPNQDFNYASSYTPPSITLGLGRTRKAPSVVGFKSLLFVIDYITFNNGPITHTPPLGFSEVIDFNLGHSALSIATLANPPSTTGERAFTLSNDLVTSQGAIQASLLMPGKIII